MTIERETTTTLFELLCNNDVFEIVGNEQAGIWMKINDIDEENGEYTIANAVRLDKTGCIALNDATEVVRKKATLTIID